MRIKLKRYIVPLMLVILAGLFVLPVLYVVAGSLMSPGEVAVRFQSYGDNFGYPQGLSLIPQIVTLEQFYTLLVENSSYIGMFWNSVLYAIAITLGTNIVIIPLAFVFAKLPFKGSKALFIVYIITMIMPFQVTLLPMYITLSRMSLLDTPWSLILPSVFAPLGVFLLHQFMRGIPDEYMEAAALETSSFFRMLVHIVIPTVKPGLIAANIIIFAEAWNMVEQPLLFLDDPMRLPLSAAMNNIMATNLNVSFSGSLLFITPIVVLYLFFEEQIIKGLESFRW